MEIQFMSAESGYLPITNIKRSDISFIGGGGSPPSDEDEHIGVPSCGDPPSGSEDCGELGGEEHKGDYDPPEEDSSPVPSP